MKVNRTNLFIFLIISLQFISFSEPVQSTLKTENLKASSGVNYLVIYQGNSIMEFVTERPTQNDENIMLSIAGAFTRLDDDQIDGLYISNGKVGNKKQINKTLGGGISIIDGKAKIFPTEKGALLTDSFIKKIADSKGSFFQQIQCVTNGVGATYKEVKYFQRRGIVEFKNGKTAIVESNKSITLKTFTDDLVELNAKNALYTDMGAWDEGWYRSPQDNKIKTIGYNRSQTKRQSNWVVFRKK